MMKKSVLWLLLLGLSAVSCNKELDLAPRSEISTKAFFSNESELKMYCNGLYDGILPGEICKGDAQSDNVEGQSPNLVVQGKHVEPSTGGGWEWEYLRRVNYFLEHYVRADEPEAVKAHYAAVARMFRAWFYFEKVKRFGDVPWYSKTLRADDPDIYKPRDPRVRVMDSVLLDLKYATARMRETGAAGEVNKWVAFALRARVALHEGTFRKYHGLPGYEEWLRDACASADSVMQSGNYRLYATGDPYHDYGELFVLDAYDPGEVLLARRYQKGLHTAGHTSNSYFNTATQGAPGLTKSLVNSYLMKDGSRFTDKPGHETLMLKEECAGRDPRLSQTVRTPGYKRYGSGTELKPAVFFAATATGYQGAKHVGPESMDGWQGNYNDIPVFRYAEVLLIYAEARAELGLLTPGDLARSVDLVRARAGMPPMDFNVTVDPVLADMYPNVSGPQKALVLELRRERRIELALEGFRYDDLMRWKCGELLERQFAGMYFPSKGAFDMDGDGTIDVEVVDAVPHPKPTDREFIELKPEGPVLSEGDRGCLIPHPVTAAGKDKSFDGDKHYYFPLPLEELVINPKLEQNPGWRKK